MNEGPGEGCVHEKDAKTAAIEWFSTAKASERIPFITDLLGCLPMEQLITVHNNVTKAKRKWKDLEPEFRKSAKIGKTVPSDSSALGPIPLGLVPTDDHPAVPKPVKPWWNKYDPQDAVAIDCEMVQLLPDFAPNLSGSDLIKAGTVSIVQYMPKTKDYKEIYSATIKWPAGSYQVNHVTKKINGFRRDSLVNGKPLVEVAEEVRKLLKGKLVITCNGASDFRSLGIMEFGREFDIFDLHSHYRKPSQVTTTGGFTDELVTQPIGLRSLYFHYYKKDIQAQAHSAKVDAEATLKIFVEQYRKEKTTNIDCRDNFEFERYSVIKTLSNRKK